MPPGLPSKNGREFDAQKFIATIGEGRKTILFPRSQTIFAQEDPGDAVLYLQTGKVRLTVVSETGKEATIGILKDGSFFGEGALAGQPLRMGFATATTDCAVLRIEKSAMVGTPWSRVNFFMNRFRKLGLIDYDGGAESGLKVHSSLLNLVLHD